METDISKLHEGTDGFYYDDFLAPDKAETFVGQLVSTQWWQKGCLLYTSDAADEIYSV